MREIGIERFRIDLIEEQEASDKQDMKMKLGKYIREMGTLNSIIPGRTNKEYREDKKEEIKEKVKEYKETNIEKINTNMKKYREENKNKIHKYGKKHYEENKDMINAHKRDLSI